MMSNSLAYIADRDASAIKSGPGLSDGSSGRFAYASAMNDFPITFYRRLSPLGPEGESTVRVLRSGARWNPSKTNVTARLFEQDLFGFGPKPHGDVVSVFAVIDPAVYRRFSTGCDQEARPT